ncbi:hypothetical protein I4U23_025521 [Adineta vaga]|nr:hypothetical protein I4U23_025521 [Adineta vaga]
MNNTNKDNRLVQYTLLQIVIVPSLICDLFLFIYFTRHWYKTIRNAPQNHLILCLLIISFIQKTTDMPLILYFFRWNTVAEKSYTFCAVWNLLNHSLDCMNLYLFAWYCIERHLFIFHFQIMKKTWCLIGFHYIPLIFFLLYALIFYLTVIFFIRICSNNWNYSLIFCGDVCYLYNSFWSLFDWLSNHLTPVLIIFIANSLLFFRILWQTIRQQRPNLYHRQKRMLIQMIFISTLYLILIVPQIIVQIIQIIQIHKFTPPVNQDDYFHYISYYINQFLPFVIFISFPKIQKNLKRCCNRTQIQPT